MITESESLYKFTKEIAFAAPRDAIELRRVSAQIISKWIKCGLDIQNDTILPFVYIESSIEDSINNNLSDEVALRVECSDVYDFHMPNFLLALEILQSDIQGSKAM